MNYSQQIAPFGVDIYGNRANTVNDLSTDMSIGDFARNRADYMEQYPSGYSSDGNGNGDGGIFGGLKLGGEGGLLDFGLKGLGAIAGIWSANKANKLAKQQFNFQKEMANANLNNTIQSYNTRLSDRARSRGFVEGQSQGQIDNYINQNKMSR